MNKFISILDVIGKDFLKGLDIALKYAIPVEKLVGLLFPTLAPEATEAVDVTTLIQNAVILVEQKYAAAGIQDATGTQKTADVLALVQGAVTSLLAKAGITADAGYISNLIAAVVAILNVQPTPASLIQTKSSGI